MKSIFQSNYDLSDIVFEGRNKDYGAYQLRKSYNTTMFKANIITVATAGLLSALFLFQKHEVVPLTETFKLTPIDITKTYKVETEKPLVTEKQKVEQVLPKETVKNTKMKIVHDDKIKPNEQGPPTIDDLKDKVSGTTTSSNPTGSDVASVVEPDKTGSGEGTETTEVFVSVSDMPEFIGGNDKLFTFIGNHLHYPSMAIENGIQGTVSIQFVVDQLGQVTKVSVLRGIGGGCDEEAMRVVKLLKFKPGKQNGTPVKVQFSLPIRFKLD